MKLKFVGSNWQRQFDSFWWQLRHLERHSLLEVTSVMFLVLQQLDSVRVQEYERFVMRRLPFVCFQSFIFLAGNRGFLHSRSPVSDEDIWRIFWLLTCCDWFRPWWASARSRSIETTIDWTSSWWRWLVLIFSATEAYPLLLGVWCDGPRLCEHTIRILEMWQKHILRARHNWVWRHRLRWLVCTWVSHYLVVQNWRRVLKTRVFKALCWAWWPSYVIDWRCLTALESNLPASLPGTGTTNLTVRCFYLSSAKKCCMSGQIMEHLSLIVRSVRICTIPDGDRRSFSEDTLDVRSLYSQSPLQSSVHSAVRTASTKDWISFEEMVHDVFQDDGLLSGLSEDFSVHKSDAREASAH